MINVSRTRKGDRPNKDLDPSPHFNGLYSSEMLVILRRADRCCQNRVSNAARPFRYLPIHSRNVSLAKLQNCIKVVLDYV